ELAHAVREPLSSSISAGLEIFILFLRGLCGRLLGRLSGDRLLLLDQDRLRLCGSIGRHDALVVQSGEVRPDIAGAPQQDQCEQRVGEETDLQRSHWIDPACLRPVYQPRRMTKTNRIAPAFSAA